MPTLGKAEGVFCVIALTLDLGEVYDLVEFLGPEFELAEVTPLVAGVVEHNDRTFLSTHLGVVILKESASGGEGLVVDRVKVTVIRRIVIVCSKPKSATNLPGSL